MFSDPNGKLAGEFGMDAVVSGLTDQIAVPSVPQVTVRRLTIIIADLEDQGGPMMANGARILGCANATKRTDPKNILIFDARENYLDKMRQAGVRNGDIGRDLPPETGGLK